MGLQMSKKIQKILLVSLTLVMIYAVFEGINKEQDRPSDSMIVLAKFNKDSSDGTHETLFKPYLIEQLMSDTCKQTKISDFTVPFIQEKFTNPNSTEYLFNERWYNLTEIGHNQWQFLNSIGDDGWLSFTLFMNHQKIQ